MKPISALLLAMALLCLSCRHEFEELPYNIFNDPSVQLFEFHGHTLTHIEEYTYEVEVSFSSIYSELNKEQQELIESIKVFRTWDPDIEVPVTETKATTRTIYETCFQLAFIGKNGERSRASEKYCVWP